MGGGAVMFWLFPYFHKQGFETFLCLFFRLWEDFVTKTGSLLKSILCKSYCITFIWQTLLSKLHDSECIQTQKERGKLQVQPKQTQLQRQIFSGTCLKARNVFIIYMIDWLIWMLGPFGFLDRFYFFCWMYCGNIHFSRHGSHCTTRTLSPLLPNCTVSLPSDFLFYE